MFTGNLTDSPLILDSFKSHLYFESAITLFIVGHGGEISFFRLAFPSPIFAQMMPDSLVERISYSAVWFLGGDLSFAFWLLDSLDFESSGFFFTLPPNCVSYF